MFSKTTCLKTTVRPFCGRWSKEKQNPHTHDLLRIVRMDAHPLARPGSGASDVSLTAGVVAAVRASRSDSTRRVYDCYTRQWADWCAARGLEAQGAGPVEVSAWLQAMHGAGASPATVRTARAALSHHHRTLVMLLAAAGSGGAEIASVPDPAASELVAATVAGISRTRTRPRGQAAALGAQAIADVLADLRRDASHLARRDAALLSVLRWGLLRRSEAAALRWDDLTIEADGSGRLTVRRSKTDQTGEGAVLYLPDQTVRLLSVWRDTAQARGLPAEPHSPMWGRPLHPSTVGRIVTRRADRAGHPGMTAHSLRVGMAQDLATAGAGLVELQTAGRWASPRMPAHYTRNHAAGRGAVARYAQQTGAT